MKGRAVHHPLLRPPLRPHNDNELLALKKLTALLTTALYLQDNERSIPEDLQVNIIVLCVTLSQILDVTLAKYDDIVSALAVGPVGFEKLVPRNPGENMSAGILCPHQMITI